MKNEQKQAKVTRVFRRNSSFPTQWYKSVGLIFDYEALEKSPRKKLTRKKNLSQRKNKKEVKGKINPIQVKPID